MQKISLADFSLLFVTEKGVSYTCARKFNPTNCLILFFLYPKSLLIFQDNGKNHHGTSLPQKGPKQTKTPMVQSQTSADLGL